MTSALRRALRDVTHRAPGAATRRSATLGLRLLEWVDLWRAVDPETRRALAAVAPGRLPAVLRRGGFRPLDLAMRAHPSVTFDVRGVPVRLPGAYVGRARELYVRGVYWQLPGFFPRPGQTVLDLGANVGLYATLAACAGAAAVAVEAQEGLTLWIEDTAGRNGVSDRVSVRWGMVGGDAGVLSTPEARRRASHFGTEEPPELRVAQLADEAGVERFDLVKMDIEGSEFALLDGDAAVGWLARVERLVMEVHLAYGELAALQRPLEAAGFTTQPVTDAMLPVDRLRATSGYLYAWR